MHMAARNNLTTKYLAIEENFLLAALHVAAMKNIPFAEGTLPDLPANMPAAPPGYVLQSQRMPIQVVVFKIKKLMSALKSNTIHSSRNVERKGALPQPPMSVLARHSSSLS